MNKLVKLSEVFDVVYGVNLELVRLEECQSTDYGAIPFVSRTEKNNGVSAFVYEMIDIEPNPAHTLSVAGGGSVLSTFYQPKPYYSGRDLYVLIPKRKMSVPEMLFYAKCISANKYRYSYGRQANKTLRDLLIPKEIPNQILNKMSDYKVNLNKKLTSKPICNKKLNLNIEQWKEFKLTEFLEISLGCPIHSIYLDKANNNQLPYVTRSAVNNGVAYFAEQTIKTDEKINKGNVITIGAEGFTAFYQPIDFVNGNKINILENKKLNKYNALFLCSVLNAELRGKFNYGRGVTKERMKQISINLPSKNGKPDFIFMENYIKSLNYSNLI